MRYIKNIRLALIFGSIAIVFSLILISSLALFSGSHTLYNNRTTPAEFCNKCHPDEASVLNLISNAHRNAGCICHGYNPNATDIYNVNVAHNLTKNIYCTDCHTSYNITTGNITIHSGIVAPNQSAHYLINNSNRSDIYQRAKEFFNNSKR